MSKSADAFRTISEVAEWMDTPAHVLRFWESKFTQVKPVKRAGGRRYYRPADMRLLGGIKKLLHEDGMTIKGVQKILREQGIKHVSSLCALTLGEEEEYEEITLADVPASEPIDTVVPFSKPAEVAETAEEAAPPETDLEHTDVTVTEVAETEEETAETPSHDPADDDGDFDALEPTPAAEDTGTVVLQVTTDAEDGGHASEDIGPAPASAAGTTEEDAAEMSPLPGFLQQSMQDRGELPASAVEAEAKDEGPVGPSALIYLARITALSPEAAKEIAPLVEKLRTQAG